MDKKKKKKKGFTLIEVLVVVLIIGILAAIAFPSYTKAVEKSRTREAVQVLSTIALGEQREKLARYKYTNEVDKLDLAYTNFSDGSKATGSTFDGEFFDYTVFGEDKQAAFAQRNNNEYTLSVDYLTKEIFCRPSSHYICQELGVLEGPKLSNYDTSNIQDWVMKDYVEYLMENVIDLWNNTCGRDLHCLQDQVEGLCSNNGEGTCLNAMYGGGNNNKVTGADGNKYYWGTCYPNDLTFYINDYGQTTNGKKTFFGQVVFRPGGSVILYGNTTHDGGKIDELASQLGLTNRVKNGDWIEYRIK